MTVLSPTADRLAHLERVGAKLRQADVEIAAYTTRAQTLMASPDREYAESVAAMRRAAMSEAGHALDGAWSVDIRAAALARAMAEQCAIEASETLRSGPVRPCLYDAARLLRQASDLIARAANERAREAQEPACAPPAAGNGFWYGNREWDGRAAE
jgi:hypothetical protein